MKNTKKNMIKNTNITTSQNIKKNKESVYNINNISIDNLNINSNNRVTCKSINDYLVFIDNLCNKVYLINIKKKKYTYYCFYDNEELVLFIFNSDGQFIQNDNFIINKLKELYQKKKMNNFIKELKKYDIESFLLKCNVKRQHIKINLDYLKINVNNRILCKTDNNYLVFNDTYLKKQYIYEKNKDYKYYCLYDEYKNEIFIFDFKGNITYDNNTIIDKIKETNELYSLYTNSEYLKVHDIKFIFLTLELEEECSIFNKELINSIVDKLNKTVYKKCPELLLKFDFTYKLSKTIHSTQAYLGDLILCLYYKKKCISHIYLIYRKNNILEIESYTEEDMENKKYNKLLRCIIIIIASELTCQNSKIDYILSRAINPISAWVLMNNFSFKLNYTPFNTPLIDYNIFEEIFDKNKKLSKKKLFDLYEKMNDKLEPIREYLMLFIYIPIHENLKIAYKILNNELLKNKNNKSIICS